MLFTFALLSACPIRYSTWEQNSLDTTWRFALNYAQARDIVFTYGPLGFLTCPLPVGSNLLIALSVQTVLWSTFAWILAELFFRRAIPLINLTTFTAFFCLAEPLFWFNGAGVENLLAAFGLLLLVDYHFHGSRVQFALALWLAGFAAVIKLTAGLILAAALAGFVLERSLELGRRALRDVVPAVLIPGAVFGILTTLTLQSSEGVLRYMRSNLEFISGYSTGMSSVGPASSLSLALQATAIFGVLMGLHALGNGRNARFYVFVLSGPIFLAFKQGFVRHDVHVTIFFAFLALSIALLSLNTSRDLTVAILSGSLFLLAGQMLLIGRSLGLEEAFKAVPGVRGAKTTWAVLHYDKLLDEMNSARKNLALSRPIDPEIRDIIRNQPVASLSEAYAETFAEGLTLRLYPVVQRYSAFTPYLDGLNADWIRDEGPLFLLSDGQTIDNRHVWAESPGTWYEVYRWYDTRVLSPKHLLLERRRVPRLAALERAQSFDVDLTRGFQLPSSEATRFWTMTCSRSAVGTAQKLFFRVPPVTLSIVRDGKARTSRVIPELLVSPVIASLPETLRDLAETLRADSKEQPAPEWISFGGAVDSYSEPCRVDTFRTR